MTARSSGARLSAGRRWRIAVAVGLLLAIAARIPGAAAESGTASLAGVSSTELRARVAAFDARLREFRAAYVIARLGIAHDDSIQDADSELDRVQASYERRFSDGFKAEGLALRDELLRRANGAPVTVTRKEAALLEDGALGDPPALSGLAGYLAGLAADLP